MKFKSTRVNDFTFMNYSRSTYKRHFIHFLRFQISNISTKHFKLTENKADTQCAIHTVGFISNSNENRSKKRRRLSLKRILYVKTFAKIRNLESRYCKILPKQISLTSSVVCLHYHFGVYLLLLKHLAQNACGQARKLSARLELHAISARYRLNFYAFFRETRIVYKAIEMNRTFSGFHYYFFPLENKFIGKRKPPKLLIGKHFEYNIIYKHPIWRSPIEI